jgi:DnaJ homolog subfamily B member 4
MSPRPSTLQFTADIKPGYKGGTKIIFRDEAFDMVFLLEEETHDRFTRVGDDLHTHVAILASQAKEGCTIEIESLDPSEEPCQVKIRPNQIDASSSVVIVKGKGWPMRKTGKRGDLVVNFRIVGKLARRKRKESRKTSAKHAK